MRADARLLTNFLLCNLFANVLKLDLKGGEFMAKPIVAIVGRPNVASRSCSTAWRASAFHR